VAAASGVEAQDPADAAVFLGQLAVSDKLGLRPGVNVIILKMCSPPPPKKNPWKNRRFLAQIAALCPEK
jgi:hypothetical protein